MQCRSDDKRLRLEEDRTYQVADLRRQIQGLSESQWEEVRKCIKDLITQQRRRLEEWVKAVYNVQSFEEVGIRAPEWVEEKNAFTFYGFVGCFRCGDLLIEVSPKVGWDNFRQMLREVLEVFSTAPVYPHRGLWIGVLFNSLSLGMRTPVEYSAALLEIADGILSLYGPLRMEVRRVISEGEVGRANFHLTSRLILRGIPMGVYERVEAVRHPLPLLILKYLNSEVVNDLKRLVVEENALKYEVAKLVEGHEKLERRLRHVTGKCCTHDQIREILEISRGNPLLRTLANLYLSYIRDRELIKRITDEGLFNIVSTHKLYELWILAYLLKYFRNRGWIYDEFKSTLNLISGGYVKLRRDSGGGTIEIEYNAKKQYKMRHDEISIRPDFIIKTKNRIFVIDAKYKSKLDKVDIYKALTYILLISQDVSNPPRYIGVLTYLGNDDSLLIQKNHVIYGLYLCKVMPNVKNTCLDSLLEAIHNEIDNKPSLT